MINIDQFSVRYPSDLIVVLDIDETLAHTHTDMKSFQTLDIYSDPKKLSQRERVYVLNILTDRNNGSITSMWGIKRPNLDEFLNFCFSYFKLVIVWSAGTYEYVHSIVPELFRNTYEPHFILTRNNCVENRGKYEKPFWKLLKDIPELEEYINFDTDEKGNLRGFKNVLIIDDRLNSFQTDPYNGILIPEYEPSPDIEGINLDDDKLLKVEKYFQSIGNSTGVDVRKIDKSKIFNN